MAQTTRTFTPQHSKLDKIEMSAKQELTYGDVQPTADVNKHYLSLADPILASHAPGYEGDDDEVGHGHEFPTQQYENSRDMRIETPYRLSSEVAYLFAAFGLGAAAVPTGITNAKTHVMTPMSRATAVLAAGTGANSQLPAMTMRVKQGSLQWLVDGLCLDTFEIESKIKEIPTIKGSWIGSGRVTDDVNAFQTPAGINHLRLDNVQIGVAASEVSQVNGIGGVTWKWNNGILADDGYTAGSGLYRSRLKVGSKRGYEFGVKLLDSSTATEYINMLANTQLKAILTYKGVLIEGAVYHSMVIAMYGMRISALAGSQAEGYRGNDLTFHPEANAAGSYMDITLINTLTARALLMST